MKIRTQAFLLILLAITILLSGCASARKAQAGHILQQCSFSLDGWSLDSVIIDSALFPKASAALKNPFPNPQVLQLSQDLLQGKTRGNLGVAWISAQLHVQSSAKDSLYVVALDGKLNLDTLIRADWKMQKTSVIAPAANSIPMSIRLPLDARLFHIMEADSMVLEGHMDARLHPDGNVIPLQFKQKRPNPKDSIRVFVQNAKKEILQSLLNGWAGSL